MKHLAIGHKVAIVDLTQGELGTRGSGPIRLQEAKDAAEVPLRPVEISNDRTTLEFQKKKDDTTS